MCEIVVRIASVTFGALGLLLASAVLLTSSAHAQAHTYKNCASSDDLKNKFHEPAPTYADGNGDGKADDYLMLQEKYKNTILEQWCINGGSSGGYYIAWKVDGTGKPFKFVGKCSWDGGQNVVDHKEVTNGDLVNVVFSSHDPKTGNYWKYTYKAGGKLVAEKYNKENKKLQEKSIDPKEEPFSYDDLPGGGDPTYCADVTHMSKRAIRRLPK